MFLKKTYYWSDIFPVQCGIHRYVLLLSTLVSNKTLHQGTLLSCLHFFGQVKIRRKLKSNDKDNGPTSPTIPSITYDSVFDSGRELSSDVYSTVGTGTVQHAYLWRTGLCSSSLQSVLKTLQQKASQLCCWTDVALNRIHTFCQNPNSLFKFGGCQTG